MPEAPVVRDTYEPGAGHAVVIGASMAGMLAARVLAGHVERVTVVERDRLPDGVQPRRGVPQGWQVHALLARGLVGLERLFLEVFATWHRAEEMAFDVEVVEQSGAPAGDTSVPVPAAVPQPGGSARGAGATAESLREAAAQAQQLAQLLTALTARD